jgi:hypothetical protein
MSTYEHISPGTAYPALLFYHGYNDPRVAVAPVHETEDEYCRSALWRNVLSIVRKSRNSSSGLHRCRRRSAHDPRRTNPMRFLMNTLLAHPIPRLIHAFPAKPSLDTLASRRCLRVPCEAPLSPSKVTGVAQLELLIFWASSILLFKAVGTVIYASKIASLSSSTPHRARYFSHTVGHVRGRLRPTLEEVSAVALNLKSHSRQRRPTRLQVMQD